MFLSLPTPFVNFPLSYSLQGFWPLFQLQSSYSENLHIYLDDSQGAPESKLLCEQHVLMKTVKPGNQFVRKVTLLWFLRRKVHIISIILPLGQIFSASQWIMCGFNMWGNVNEGRGFCCWLPFGDATLVIHGTWYLESSLSQGSVMEYTDLSIP